MVLSLFLICSTYEPGPGKRVGHTWNKSQPGDARNQDEQPVNPAAQMATSRRGRSSVMDRPRRGTNSCPLGDPRPVERGNSTIPPSVRRCPSSPPEPPQESQPGPPLRGPRAIRWDPSSPESGEDSSWQRGYGNQPAWGQWGLLPHRRGTLVAP